MARNVGEERAEGRGPWTEPVVSADREDAEGARQGLRKEAIGGFMCPWLLPSVLVAPSKWPKKCLYFLLQLMNQGQMCSPWVGKDTGEKALAAGEGSCSAGLCLRLRWLR